MRIDSANLGMDSVRLYKSSQAMRRDSRTDVMNNTFGGGVLTSDSFSQFFEKKHSKESETNGDLEKVTEGLSSIESPAETTLNPTDNIFDMMTSLRPKVINQTSKRDVASQFQKMHELFIRNLMKLIFGHGKEKNSEINAECDESMNEMNEGTVQAFNAPAPPQLVATYEATSFTYSEFEYTSFNATGIVNTADGRSIDINLSLNMSSRFVETYSKEISTLSYRCTDPLVINLDDAPASLSDMKFFFDLDADGEEEEISNLSSGKGFLALDKNGDGIINDGSELFGASSGDGFKDLAQYDLDGNGWIDENDEIFDKLKIWVKDGSGEDVLYTLKDKNVGAIFLGNADTQFKLNNEDHSAVNGYVRKTGVFLYETGVAGTIQHVDLVS